jgi:hypothetical protein
MQDEGIREGEKVIGECIHYGVHINPMTSTATITPTTFSQ